MSLINKYFTGLFVLSAFLFLSACKKEKLSPEPQTAFSEAQAFANPQRIQQQVFGVYSAMKNGNFLGGRGLVYNDVRGEDWLNITGNGVTGLAAWNFSIVSSDNQTEGFWTNGYATINRANVVLQGLDENEAKVGTAVANNYRGELRFLRAVSYFYLVNLYGRRPYNADNGASLGVPLRLRANKGVSTDTINLVRSTVAEVYNQILADLNFAELNLPATYIASGDTNIIWAHKNSAIAFKSRVYLNMARYADVITEANKLVPATMVYVAPSGVQNRLEPNILNVFRTYTTTGGREMIFALPMAQSNGPGTQNGLALYHNAEFALNPAGILGNAQFSATDARRTAFVVNTAAPFRYSKFNDDNNNYVPIIRYSEVMLNLAEALARTNAGVNARALTLLNAVHQRSDPATVLAPASQADLTDDILAERRIEFLG
ncbi:MAG TPA: RagB/SusD family nutrient uptake outer membrane protein, partial [Flavisolibacter sp.]|nr:RagB/SusD family nutrient uptake outer membrane protein [Flavisolibacter sp.]